MAGCESKCGETSWQRVFAHSLTIWQSRAELFFCQKSRHGETTSWFTTLLVLLTGKRMIGRTLEVVLMTYGSYGMSSRLVWCMRAGTSFKRVIEQKRLLSIELQHRTHDTTICCRWIRVVWTLPVGGLEHEPYFSNLFNSVGKNHHPNWPTHISEG